MAKTKTKTTTIVSRLTADITDLTPAQRKTVLLDAYLAADAKASAASKAKGTARDAVMAATKHGQKVKASDGRTFMIRNEVVDTNNHAKVANSLAAKLGLTPKQLEAEYKKVAGTTTKKEIKPA